MNKLFKNTILSLCMTVVFLSLAGCQGVFFTDARANIGELKKQEQAYERTSNRT